MNEFEPAGPPQPATAEDLYDAMLHANKIIGEQRKRIEDLEQAATGGCALLHEPERQRSDRPGHEWPVIERLRELMGNAAPERRLKFEQTAADAIDLIAELKAALNEIHGAAYPMSLGRNGVVTTICVPIGVWVNAMRWKPEIER